MTNPTVANISTDIGELYDDIDEGTTAVAALITKAQATIKDITGTTVAYDIPIRELTNAYCCQQVLGSRKYQDISIGGLTIKQKDVLHMRDGFLLYAEKALRVKGFTLSGKHIRFSVVNL